jgi:quinol monooxygenase YgiN
MILKSKTQPGQREAVRQLFEQHLAPRAQTNESQELVIWCADDHDPDMFYVFELYSNHEEPAIPLEYLIQILIISYGGADIT